MTGSNSSTLPSKHTVIASWVFGSLLLLFYLGVFAFAPDALPEFKHKQLAIISALLCGLFTFFLVGSLQISLRLNLKWPELALQGGGGLAAFVLILLWWNNPDFAPVHSQKAPAATPSVPAVSSPPVTTIKQTTLGDASPASIEKIPLENKNLVNKNIVKKTEGQNSPAIISGGDVSIKTGE
jgi:hypothetical protein